MSYMNGRPRLNEPTVSKVRPRLPAQDVLVRDTRGDRVIAFCEAYCRIPDGPDVGNAVILRDWQKDIIKQIYDGENEDGFRIVREAVLTMARKNAKTALASMLMLAHLIGPEALRNSRIYSAAYDREQASIVYNNVANMVMLDRFLNSQIKLVDTLREARWYAMGIIYKALSAESRTKHGLNPAFVILDELGQFGANRKLYDVLKTSMGVQAEPLMLVISTQAEDDIALMSQLVDYGRDVNSGTVQDDSFKLFEYIVPPALPTFDEQYWHLANPALGDFRSLDEMRSFARRAKLLPSVQRKFENLYLNRRVSSGVSLISAEAWATGAHPLPDEAVLRKCDAFIGIDLSSKKDLTALVVAFRLPDNIWQGRSNCWAVRPYFFTPADTMAERHQLDRIPYVDWHGLGLLEAPQGSVIDYGVVAKRLLALIKNYKVVAIAYDRWRMDVLKRELYEYGFDADDGRVGFLEFGQGFKDMSPAVETLEQHLADNRLVHGSHPVLSFNVASGVGISDEAGNRKVDKRNSRAKIDGLVAMLMALHVPNRLSELGIHGPSVYEQRGMHRLGSRKEAAAAVQRAAVVRQGQGEPQPGMASALQRDRAKLREQGII